MHRPWEVFSLVYAFCLNGLKYFKPFKPTEPIDPALHLSRRLGVCLERLTGIDTDGAGAGCGARGTERPPSTNSEVIMKPRPGGPEARRPGCGVEALSMREFWTVEVKFSVSAELTFVQHGVWRASGEKQRRQGLWNAKPNRTT
ncbi:hypothetical protein DFH09DRAFT_1088272 [Mycena vulgaris]|nr:hypothetical protein DFH09DRAFT_1088272 [Mycena vulgaris]